MSFETPLKKKNSGLNRAIGLDKESQAAAQDYFANQKQGFRELHSLGDTQEREKYEKLINFLNKKLQTFLVGYGLREAQDFTIEDVVINPNKRFHVFPKVSNNAEALATYHSSHSKIYIREAPDEESVEEQGDFLGFLSHEMIHGQAFNSITLSEAKDGVVDARPRRGGIINHGSNSSYKSGNWLNEAVTEELNVRFLKSLLQDSDTSEDLKPFILSYLTTTMGVYPDERIVFHFMLKSLQQLDLDRYQDLEDVFKLFSQAALNGKLLLLARSMEKAFGKKSLRAYMGMSDEVVEAAANNLVASIFTEEPSKDI
jgi:hypothetical protein